MLQIAIVFITLALLFYTVGVWAEKMKKVLLKWHLAVFWLGFICDTIGTAMMGRISDVSAELNVHSVTGAIAIALMCFHAAWATFVIVRKNEGAIQAFHKFSIVVWCIWLIPYFTGMFMGMHIG